MNDLPAEIWEDVPDWVNEINVDSNHAAWGYSTNLIYGSYCLATDGGYWFYLGIQVDSKSGIYRRPQGFKTP